MGQAARILVFLVLFVTAIAAPIAGGFLMAWLGSPIYVLQEGGPGEEWLRERAFAEDGSRVLVRRYDTAGEAARAARRIGDNVDASSRRTTLGTTHYERASNGRHGLIAPVAEYVVHVEAPSAEAVETRFDKLGFVRENPRKNPLYLVLTEQLPILIAGIVIYTLLCGLLMARGAAWAARIMPVAGVIPASRSALRNRLLEINQMNLPFQVTELRPGRFVAEWRIADAKWVGLMQAGGLKSIHRIFVDLDERKLKARVLDRATRSHWQGGLAGLMSRFSFFQGIQFFQYERGSMVGLLYDRQTGWSIREGYNYRFSLSEMKNPLIEAVTGSGWTWQPVVTLFRPIGG